MVTDQPGSDRPRKFLTLLSHGDDKTFTDGSGPPRTGPSHRHPRQSADRARDRESRMPQWHFDQAIVRTVSDFGTRSEPPTHPEMLDWMATWFMDKLVAQEAAQTHPAFLDYQQGSVLTADALGSDQSMALACRSFNASISNRSATPPHHRRKTGSRLCPEPALHPGVFHGLQSLQEPVSDALQPKTSVDRRTHLCDGWVDRRFHSRYVRHVRFREPRQGNHGRNECSRRCSKQKQFMIEQPIHRRAGQESPLSKGLSEGRNRRRQSAFHLPHRLPATALSSGTHSRAATSFPTTRLSRFRIHP